MIKTILAIAKLILALLEAMKDREVRAIANEARAAKTPEEKRAAAAKIADAMYRNK